MVMAPEEYNNSKQLLRDPNEYLSMLRAPSVNEKIYQIDLNSRKIESPVSVAVDDDHNAKVIWFICDRFFDNIDLNNGTCWIQYINASGEMFYFAAPIMIDVANYGSDKILIPWIVSKEVSKTPGNVQYAIQFFKVSEDGLKYLYILNTSVASTKVLSSLPVVAPENDAKEYFSKGEIQALWDRYYFLEKKSDLYWLELV